MGTAHADHQKDVIGLVFSQRLGRQVRQKRIDPAQIREGRSGRGVRRNELRIRVTAAASDNTIARVVRLVEEAQESKAPTEGFIERFARYYTPGVVVVAALVAIIPPLLFGGVWSEWVYKSLANSYRDYGSHEVHELKFIHGRNRPAACAVARQEAAESRVKTLVSRHLADLDLRHCGDEWHGGDAAPVGALLSR